MLHLSFIILIAYVNYIIISVISSAIHFLICLVNLSLIHQISLAIVYYVQLLLQIWGLLFKIWSLIRKWISFVGHFANETWSIVSIGGLYITYYFHWLNRKTWLLHLWNLPNSLMYHLLQSRASLFVYTVFVIFNAAIWNLVWYVTCKSPIYWLILSAETVNIRRLRNIQLLLIWNIYMIFGWQITFIILKVSCPPYNAGMSMAYGGVSCFLTSI